MEIKQRRDYIKLLDKMHGDRSIAINEVFGINPWPIIKIQSAYFLHLLFVGRAISDNEKQPLLYKKRKPFPITELLQYLKSSWQLYAAKKIYKDTLQSKILLVGFEKHKIDLLDKRVNIYTEPFVDYFSELNIPTEILWIDKTATNSKAGLEYLFSVIKRNVKAKNIIKRAISSKYNSEYKKAFNVSASVKNFFQNEDSSYADNIAFRIQTAILENELLYQSSLRFLEILSPFQIVNYCYYNNGMLALQRAASFLNIPVTEYQHSIQADDHLAYSQWKNCDDYSDYFPSIFWVWTNDDAKRIKKNFSDKIYQPQIITGGNVFLVQQKSASVAEFSLDKAVLITLQGSWIPQFIENVIAIRKDFKWYFRLHPRYPDDRTKLIAFHEKFQENVEMKLANELPLYSLFQKVQFNITSSSGTALEAPSFDVVNLIFGQDGYNCFEPYIQSNQFHFIDNAETLNDLLDNIKQSDAIGIGADITSIRNDLKELYNGAIV